MVADSVAYMAAAGRRVVFDAEHFFDGYRADRGYALEVLAAAADAGADTLVLCDTNGGTLPDDVGRIVAEVVGPVADRDRRALPQRRLVRGGQLGRRGGRRRRCTCRARRTATASAAATPTCSRSSPAWSSSAGTRCCRTGGWPRWPRPRGRSRSWRTCRSRPGSRTSARRRSPPRRACTPRRSPGGRTPTRTSTPARSATRRRCWSASWPAAATCWPRPPSSASTCPTTRRWPGQVLEQVKEAEHRGYAFEAADASFELLVRKSAGVLPAWFKLEGYRVVIERATTEDRSEAIVRLRLGDDRVVAVGEGVGPVHALDQALRRGAVRGLPGTGRHPPGRLQGAHPGRPRGDQRGHPGHADLGRRRRASGPRSACPTTS